MKFNFRKITSVLASAVMLGSTVGIAAAASYPAPFVSNGNADVAIVVGSNAAVDWAPAFDIGLNLQAALSEGSFAPGTSTGASASGENVKIETSSQKLHLGSNLTDVRTTKITKSDLPVLLARKTYRSYDSQTYDYEQEIDVQPNIAFTHFANNDLNNRVPTVGLNLPSQTSVLNYTLNFLKAAESDVDSSGRLEDLQNTKMWILGKEYTLLNAYNNTGSNSVKLELMAGSATDVVYMNEEKTITVNGKDYNIKLTFVDSSNAKFEVNGERTGALAKGGTFKLSDGTQIGVRDISYQAFAGGIMSAEISVGAEKLTLEHGATVKLNDKDVTGLTASITKGLSGTRQTISAVKIAWKTDDRSFVTPDKEIVFPGLGSLKLTMTNLTTPAMETTKIQNNGNLNVEVRTTLKDGPANFIMLSGNGTTFNKIGREGADPDALITTAGSTFNFDTDTDLYFVASWNSSTASESYLLEAKISTEGSGQTNYTTLNSLITGSDKVEKCKVQSGQTCTIGNVVITISNVDYANRNFTATGGSGVTFNNLFTKEGLLMHLPVDGVTGGGYGSVVNITTAGTTAYAVRFVEEDRYSARAGQVINVTLGWTSDSKSQVTGIQGNFLTDLGVRSSSNYFESGGSSSSTQKYLAYVPGDLASKVTYDQSPTQDTAEIEYHGGESYGNIFLIPPESVITGGTTTSGGSGVGKQLGNVVVKDSEISTVSGKDLIVVGGSCVNTVAAKMLGSTTPLCGTDFTQASGIAADQFIIKVMESPYSSDKVAMLVAGYEAADTVKAARFVVASKPSTAIGTVIKKVTLTEADVGTV